MLCRPFYHKPQNARRKTASEQSQSLNSDQSLLVPVAHMEVRWCMIAVVHSNHDSEKTTDLGQAITPLPGDEPPTSGWFGLQHSIRGSGFLHQKPSGWNARRS